MVLCIKVTHNGLLTFWCVCHTDSMWVVVIICCCLNINLFKCMLLIYCFIYSFNKYLPNTNWMAGFVLTSLGDNRGCWVAQGLSFEEFKFQQEQNWNMSVSVGVTGVPTSQLLGGSGGRDVSHGLCWDSHCPMALPLDTDLQSKRVRSGDQHLATRRTRTCGKAPVWPMHWHFHEGKMLEHYLVLTLQWQWNWHIMYQIIFVFWRIATYLIEQIYCKYLLSCLISSTGPN